MLPNVDPKLDGVEANHQHASLLNRVTSWWASDDNSQLTSKNSSGFKLHKDIHIDLDKFSIEQWTHQRVEILEILWGHGNRGPGDDALNMELFNQVALNSKSKILDIAAGLGNCARMLAKHTYAHVDVVECHSNLLPYFKKITRNENQEAFISILKGNLNDVKLPKVNYDLIYGREALFKIKNKQSVLEKMVDALKTNGHLVFTDFVLEKDASSYKIFKNWSAREKQTVYPTSMAAYKKIIDGFDMEMRPIKDYSQQYIHHVNVGWLRLKEHIKTHDLDDAFVDVMVQESDLWLSRVRALQSGKLKLVKFHVTFK